jgi:hypothetical protein
VRDVRGMRDQMFHGNPAALLTSFFGRALHLDDKSSNVEVSHNVFADTSHAAIFFHSGSNNTVWNNVVVNSTFNKGSTVSVQLLFKQSTHGTVMPGGMKDNRLFRNVIWTPRDSEELTPDVPMLGGTNAGALSVARGGGTHHNWYYRRGKGIAKGEGALVRQQFQRVGVREDGPRERESREQRPHVRRRRGRRLAPGGRVAAQGRHRVGGPPPADLLTLLAQFFSDDKVAAISSFHEHDVHMLRIPHDQRYALTKGGTTTDPWPAKQASRCHHVCGAFFCAFFFFRPGTCIVDYEVVTGQNYVHGCRRAFAAC